MRLIAAIVAMLPLGAVLAHAEIGKVVSVEGAVTIERAGERAQAVADMMLEASDVIKTGVHSGISFILKDGTAFKVGGNAEMSLKEFNYDPKGTSNKALIALQRGVFTFLAGKVANTGDLKVTTPVGTMGIRGTAPHVEILPDGTTKFGTLLEEYKH